MKLLNLGCGSNYHPLWVNIDFVSSGPNVIGHNLMFGIPFPDQTFDAVYHSHVLEHFPRTEALNFISECHRVLTPGGILRIAIPDLEAIARLYIKKLEECVDGVSSAELDYDWLMLELYDQAARGVSGGEMNIFLSHLTEKDRGFVRSRIGTEAERFWVQESRRSGTRSPNVTLDRKSLKRLFSLMREKLAGWLVYCVAGKMAFKSFRKGIFRDSGEIHQWMYDRYSIKRLLEQAGFVDVKVCAASESQIVSYETYSLDILNGVARKPDSLYVEALKA